MKHLKTYEKLNEPQIGDYVICEESSQIGDKRTIQFISNNIGQFIKWNTYPNSSRYPFIIYYETASVNLFSKKTREMNLKEIIYFSKNKEDCEDYLAAKKYNL